MAIFAAEEANDVAFDISEELVSVREQKTASTGEVDFNGALKTPLRLREDVKEGCGGQLWPAGMILAKYLLRKPKLDSLRGSRILELGAGGGLVGLAIALALKDYGDDRPAQLEMTTMHLTDQATMLPLMERNIELNELSRKSVTAGILDWGMPLSPDFVVPQIVLAADCVYFEPAFPLLLQTLQDVIGDDTVCYFCFKKRRRADIRFMKEAKRTFKVEEIMDDPDRVRWSKEALFLYKITRKA